VNVVVRQHSGLEFLAKGQTSEAKATVSRPRPACCKAFKAKATKFGLIAKPRTNITDYNTINVKKLNSLKLGVRTT